jgi:UDP-glucuronate 4-epimerase
VERSNYFGRVASRWHTTASARLLGCTAVLLAMTLFVFYRMSSTARVGVEGGIVGRSMAHQWELKVRQSCLPKRENDAMVVLVTGAAGFVGTHVSLALKKRGDGVVGLDNFNDYYETSLKRARQDVLKKHGVFVVEGDINDEVLLKTLFELGQFTHIMHLAAQAGVRYAMQNPGSYVHSNIAGLVNLFEVCKASNPQPAIVWASSSSVYGLNSKVCVIFKVVNQCCSK